MVARRSLGVGEHVVAAVYRGDAPLTVT